MREYTWQQFEADCNVIAAWAEEQRFMNVFGIPRGGMVIAVVLSYLLDIPLLLGVDEISRHTLVVDDLSDTGETFALLEKRLGFRPRVAALFFEKKTRWMPEFTAHEKSDWIKFPWETPEGSTYNGTFRKFLEARPKQ